MANEKTALLDKGNSQMQPVPINNPIVVNIPPQIDEEINDKYGTLTLQQIARYADDPWWRRLRRGLMISVWTSMALMILAAVLIAIVEQEHVCTAGGGGRTTVSPLSMSTMATAASPNNSSRLVVDGILSSTAAKVAAAAVAAAATLSVPVPVDDVIQTSAGLTAATIATARNGV